VLNLEAGATATLTSRAFDTRNKEIVAHAFWSTQNAAVATVSDQGIVTAVAPGATQIAASAGGRSGFAAVTVSQRAVALVRLTPATGDVVVGGTLQLVADVLDNTGTAITGRPVSWSTTDAAIAAVSATGLVTGVAQGSATIRATSGGIAGTSVVTVTRIPVATVIITPPNAAVQIGETRPLTAAARDAAGNLLDGRVIVWSSSNDAVAAVSQSGVVTGVGSGIATITAAAPGAGVNGSTPAGTAGISVVPVPVARVTVVPPTATIVAGGFANLAVSLFDANGAPLTTTGRTVTWTTSSPAIATVGGSGQVVAVAPGTATITATVVTPGQTASVQGTATITVTSIPVASVQVTPASLSIDAGTIAPLSATAKDAAGNVLTGRTITWSSSSSSVATVSALGVVTAVAAGAATITATVDGISGTATITVTQVPVATVTVSPNPASVQERGSVQLNAVPRDAIGNVLTGRTIVWSSSNNSVAAASQAGLVTGIAPGNATVSAAAIGGGAGGSSPSGSSAVTVSFAPVATVQVVPLSASVNIGGTAQFAATLLDGTGQTLSATGRTVAWSSSDATKATVNASTGVATGVALGSATITAAASSPGQSPAVTATASLTVSSVPVATVTVSPSPATVHVGSAYQRTFTAVTRDALNNILAGRAVVWTSGNQTVAQVDPSTGVVTGVATGSATITATSEGKSGTSTVTVDLVNVSSVQVVPASATLTPPSTQQLTATPRDSAGNAITGAALGGRTTAWTTSNAAAATVSTAGLVTAQGTGSGSATITATVGGTAGTSAITVLAPVNSVTMTASADSVIAPAQVTGTATVRDAASNPLSGRTISFTSSAPGATVAPASGNSTATGTVAFTVTGVSAGTATITGTSETKSGTVIIRVLNAVSTVTVTAPKDSVIGSGTIQAAATLRDAGGAVLTGRPTTWNSSATGVATVNGSGLITAVAPGTTSITATSEGKTSAPLTVRILAAVNTVTVTAPADSIIGTATLQATATLRDAANNVITGRPILWSTNAAGVATVGSSTGLITGVAPGTATITATSETKSGTFLVRVVAAVAGVTITAPVDSLIGAGTLSATVRVTGASSAALPGRTVTTNSSSTGVATVSPASATTNSSGQVALTITRVSTAAGSTTITSTSAGVSGTFIARMLAAVNTVTVTAPGDSIIGTGTLQATATLRDVSNNVLTGRPVAWSSSASGVATVNSTTGLITGVSPGSSVISANAEGKTGTLTVRVLAAVSSLTVSFPTDSLIGPGSIPGTVTLRDASSNPVQGRAVTIGSSNAAVATAAPASGISNASGQVVITAGFVSAGTANITASSGSAGGAKTVRMLAPVANVVVAPSTASVAPLGTTTLTVTVTGASAQPLPGRVCTITSSAVGVATVSPGSANTNASGQISVTVTAGVLPGSATITATCEGKVGTSTITV
jgi:uncharacterized protein YjdB